jgi:hypothetical protein
MMVRLPRGFHPQASTGQGSSSRWRPGWRGTGQQPIRRVPITSYTRVIPNVPLTGGQVQGTVSGAGTVTVQIGPHGLGNVWYPAAAVISTTTGANDNSTCMVFLGAQGVNNSLVGQSYAGGGDTIGLSVPSMTPGDLLICTWAGGSPGDTAYLNIVGTMDALTT